MDNAMEHILVGMSGGVDSSVAALLLLRQGCAVTGVTLRLRGGRLAGARPDRPVLPLRGG